MITINFNIIGELKAQIWCMINSYCSVARMNTANDLMCIFYSEGRNEQRQRVSNGLPYTGITIIRTSSGTNLCVWGSPCSHHHHITSLSVMWLTRSDRSSLWYLFVWLLQLFWVHRLSAVWLQPWRHSGQHLWQHHRPVWLCKRSVRSNLRLLPWWKHWS